MSTHPTSAIRHAERASVWRQEVELPELPSLSGLHDTEVCVVGGGIAGVTVAYELARAGREVVLVEARPAPGGGETGSTSAHLSWMPDRGASRLRDLNDADTLRTFVESHSEAVDRIEQIAAEEGIECEFARIDGFLLAHDERAGRRHLDDDMEALREAGVGGITRVEHVPGVRDVPEALRVARQARFHPLRYLGGLVEAAARRGARLHGRAPLERLEEAGDRLTVRTPAARIRCDQVVIATNSPVVGPEALHARQLPCRTYLVMLEVDAGAAPDALLWDTGSPFHYARRVQEGGRSYLLVGGGDHRAGEDVSPDERYERLTRWAHQHFPVRGDPVRRWSGQTFETADGLAMIGRLAGGPEIFVVTGDCGQGITHAGVAGLMLPDLLRGEDHPWAASYRPGRLGLRAVRELLRTNLGTAASLFDWIRPLGPEKPAAEERGAGWVERRKGQPVAVYRDAEGRLHHRSAVCSHLGCVVRWNHAERGWDCPCHGSRFGPTGKVVGGPAREPLEELED